MAKKLRPRLELAAITKRFPGVLANDQVSFRVFPGEILALLGENGAGKSTLMNIIYGVLKPDSGSLAWEDRETVIPDPQTARRMGIGMVFQHFSLLETLTVRENLVLSLPREVAGDRGRLDRTIAELGDKHGLHIDADARVANLSTGEKQRVEIARCLLQQVKLLILDEPTSVLTPGESEQLFSVLRQLADDGCSIVFISHKLGEVRALCQRAVILRAGRVAGECNPTDTSRQDLTRLMLGDQVDMTRQLPPGNPGDRVLTLDRVSVRPRAGRRNPPRAIDLSLRAGEIVGIGGVSGSGQEQLLDLVNGELTPARGDIRFGDRTINTLSVAKRRRLGICTVPVERLGRGAAPGLSLTDNCLLTHYLGDAVQQGLIRWARVRQITADILRRFDVRTEGPEAQARTLSGGNLQKFLVGREIAGQPTVLACYNPTWGVDVGSASRIHQALAALRDRGAALLVLSEDLEELFLISDRMGALCSGRLSPVLPRSEVDMERLGGWMTGDFIEQGMDAATGDRGAAA